MASFEKNQELLLPCLVEEIIDDEEFSVLYEAYTPQNLSKTKILPNAKLIFVSIKGISRYLLKPVMEPKAYVSCLRGSHIHAAIPT